jgi:hypothetical protein
MGKMMSQDLFQRIWDVYQSQMSRIQWRHYFRRNPEFEAWMLENEPDALGDIVSLYANKRVPVFE